MTHTEARRISLISEYKIGVVLDVGANTGQYAIHLRKLGFAGRIVSFEPLQAEYAQLETRASKDPLWETLNCALGDQDSRQEINIAENSYSSSMLNVLPRHLDSEPKVRSIGKQMIELRKLDSIFEKLCSDSEVSYLKLDAQGFEMRILEGAEKSLEKIDTIQLEMSLMPLYQGETLLPEMMQWMYQKGYVLVGFEPGHSDSKAGQLLQADGIFHRFRG
jgi:FkbM family methyltransferase